MQHLLLATDGSACAEHATEVAATLAKAVGGRLSILTVGGYLSGDEVKQLARAERDIGDALDALSDQVLATPSIMRSAWASPMSKSRRHGAIRRK